ncbi:YeeE/YedE family protein [Streptomyces sp. NRRL S-15]|uniref:YeeE/YedE family protein n=1 Tax=Streptomyces sp. NRRL S-15 TaxID=1463886 RepID=UPI0004CC3D92|nr:YeeE/YedE family protein [Streptomyces sp. NRRL S-15]
MTTAPPAGPAAPPRALPALLVPSPTSVPRPEAPPLPRVRRAPLVVSGLLAAALTAYVWFTHGAKPGVLLVLGLGLGVALFHSRFGFTSAWRQLIAVGNGTGLRAHALLLGTTATLFALVIGTSTGLFGSQPAPSGGSLGVGLVVGSLIFAIGMQLGGACASGTLFAVGSGQTSVLLTLGGFIAGATLAAWQFDLWKDLPAWEPVVLSDHIGWFGSWAVTIAALLLVVLITRRVQARRNPPPLGVVPSARTAALRALRGSWPLAAGALVLAVLGAGVLMVSGGAWGVTSAFSLWGSELVGALGGHPENWTWWRQAGNAEMLAGPVLADKRQALHRGIPWRTAVASVLGGVLMGIGARLAGGCNIGAYLAGVASGSLSGWLWGAVALAGTWIGLRLRPLFGLGNPKPGDGVC